MKPDFDYKKIYDEEEPNDINREDMILIIMIIIMAMVLIITFDKYWKMLPR